MHCTKFVDAKVQERGEKISILKHSLITQHAITLLKLWGGGLITRYLNSYACKYVFMFKKCFALLNEDFFFP